jgi:hypothetical protein
MPSHEKTPSTQDREPSERRDDDPLDAGRFRRLDVLTAGFWAVKIDRIPAKAPVITVIQQCNTLSRAAIDRAPPVQSK